MTSEKSLENRIKAYLDEKGCYYIKYWGGGYFTRAGVPDLLACVGGRFVGIEVKASKGVVSDLQEYHLEQIQKAGGIGIVVRPSNFEQMKGMIDDLLQSEQDEFI